MDKGSTVCCCHAASPSHKGNTGEGRPLVGGRSSEAGHRGKKWRGQRSRRSGDARGEKYPLSAPPPPLLASPSPATAAASPHLALSSRRLSSPRPLQPPPLLTSPSPAAASSSCVLQSAAPWRHSEEDHELYGCQATRGAVALTPWRGRHQDVRRRHPRLRVVCDAITIASPYLVGCGEGRGVAVRGAAIVIFVPRARDRDGRGGRALCADSAVFLSLRRTRRPNSPPCRRCYPRVSMSSIPSLPP